MLPCVVLDCMGMRLGVPSKLKPSSLSDVSLLLSAEFDGKKGAFLFDALLFTEKERPECQNRRRGSSFTVSLPSAFISKSLPLPFLLKRLPRMPTNDILLGVSLQ